MVDIISLEEFKQKFCTQDELMRKNGRLISTSVNKDSFYLSITFLTGNNRKNKSVLVNLKDTEELKELLGILNAYENKNRDSGIYISSIINSISENEKKQIPVSEEKEKAPKEEVKKEVLSKINFPAQVKIDYTKKGYVAKVNKNEVCGAVELETFLQKLQEVLPKEKDAITFRFTKNFQISDQKKIASSLVKFGIEANNITFSNNKSYASYLKTPNTTVTKQPENKTR